MNLRYTFNGMHYVLGEEFERFIALLRVAVEYEQPQSLNLCFIVDENNNKNYEKPAGNGPQNQDNRYCHNVVGFHPTPAIDCFYRIFG